MVGGVSWLKAVPMRGFTDGSHYSPMQYRRLKTCRFIASSLLNQCNKAKVSAGVRLLLGPRGSDAVGLRP